jgi:hypothetical protein
VSAGIDAVGAMRSHAALADPDLAVITAVEPEHLAGLVELVTGRHPFAEEKKFEQMLVAHAMKTPPVPSTVAQQPIPARLDGIILTALAKNPDERFANASEMARALKHFAIDFIAPDGSSKPMTAADDATMVPLSSTAEVAMVPDVPHTLPFTAAPPPSRPQEEAGVAPNARTGAAVSTPTQISPAGVAPSPALTASEQVAQAPADQSPVPIRRFVLAFVIVMAIAIGIYFVSGW